MSGVLLTTSALLQTSFVFAQAAAPPAEAPPAPPAPTGEAEPAKPADAPTTTEPTSPPPAETAPPNAEPAPSGAAATSGSGTGGDVDFGLYAPTTAAPAAPPAEEPKKAEEQSSAIFAEDWWRHTRPTLELHGNFRVRANLMSHFALGRIDAPDDALWPRPADDYYRALDGNFYGASACTPAENPTAANVGTVTNTTAGTGTTSTSTTASRNPGDASIGCSNSTQAGANLRFRIEPALIISDNLRIRSQIDLFDNLVMGSTPEGYQNVAGANGYQVSSVPSGLEASSQAVPVSGVNSLQDSISVRRAWAEYETPVGQARFGRMPDHWGLGMHRNAGNDIDGDYQTTVDRIAFVTGIPSLSLYAAGAWDFANEGATSQGFATRQYPAYDIAQYDDVSSMNLQLYRRMDPQLEKLALARGELVVNGGLYLTYRFQRLTNAYTGGSATCAGRANALGCTPGQIDGGLIRRGLDVWTPDLFAEVKYRKFKAGFELVTHQGTIDTQSTVPGDNDYRNAAGGAGYRVNQWGLAGEITQTLVEDKLKLGLYFGWASGDGDTGGTRGLLSDEQLGDNTLSTFRFHPNYRVDLILHRHILRQVSGTYYVKPMAQYDFFRDPAGLRLGGRAEAIWTRASHFMQTPGHGHDLGVELDGTIYFQSKDGVLNDDPTQTGGFYGMLNYGVFFPMNGLGYLTNIQQNPSVTPPGVETAQMVRLFLGVAY